MSRELRLRQAARAVVTDPARRVLLVHFEFPERHIWACPGGGLEPGETHEAALRRELTEEVGLLDPVIGPCIWTARTSSRSSGGRWDGQVERYFLVETDAFEPSPLMTAEELRAEWVTEARWWTAEELDASVELHAPRQLPRLLRQLREQGPPREPIDVGV